MAIKAVMFCASVLLVQTISGQCVKYTNSCGCGGYGSGYANTASLGVGTSGGGLPIVSVSPIAANGLTVISNNDITGSLAANGQLPLLSLVSLEGSFPTGGAGSVSYSCGDGSIGISAAPGAGGVGAGYGALGGGYGRIGGCGCL